MVRCHYSQVIYPSVHCAYISQSETIRADKISRHVGDVHQLGCLTENRESGPPKRRGHQVLRGGAEHREQISSWDYEQISKGFTQPDETIEQPHCSDNFPFQRQTGKFVGCYLFKELHIMLVKLKTMTTRVKVDWFEKVSTPHSLLFGYVRHCYFFWTCSKKQLQLRLQRLYLYNLFVSGMYNKIGFFNWYFLSKQKSDKFKLNKQHLSKRLKKCQQKFLKTVFSLSNFTGDTEGATHRSLEI